jgi:hypothetical protein
LGSFLHFPVTSPLLGPNILLNTLFSNTLSLRCSLNVSDQLSHPYKTIIFVNVIDTKYIQTRMVHLCFQPSFHVHKVDRL